MRRGNASEVYAKAKASKLKHLEAELAANNLKEELISRAESNHSEAVRLAEEKRLRALQRLSKELDDTESELDSPEKSTAAIADKFNLENLDK